MRILCRAGMRLMVLLALYSCGKTENDKNGLVSLKLRSTGLQSVALTLADKELPLLMLDTMTANVVELEYYKVPIRRINLVSGFDGTAYTAASPNFYTCDSSKTEDECLVDLSKSILVDNLLSTANVTDNGVTADASYDGAAIEFCKEGSATTDSYKIKIKGSVVMGGTLYYTSATQGLSSSLTSAEEVQISVKCSGKTTSFLSPVTLGPDKSVTLVIYADPNGNVFGTSSAALANSNCTGTGAYSVCASLPSIFIAVDTAVPTIERYALNVTSTKAGSAYRNLLLKLVVDSASNPVGATLQEHYRNDTAEKSLNTSFMDLNRLTKNADATYDLAYFSQTVIKNFKRGTDTGNKVLALADGTLIFNQKSIP